MPSIQGALRAHAILFACLLAACQPSPPGDRTGDAPGTGTVSRQAVDALDRVTAMSRKARVSDVEYDLHVDLQRNGETFAGEVTIRYELSGAASDLTLDFGGGTVSELRVNGEPVPADYNGYFLTLPAEALRQGQNTVYVAYRHPYSEDGTGLHRFVDPEDARVYLYTYLWPYYANRLFPAFDQPNLKARISLSVLAPEDWTVVSMGAGEPEPATNGASLWRFETTPNMSTYVFSLHAGPYRVWEDTAEGVPIRLMARQSLAEFVAVEGWFDVTKRGLAYYGDYFGIAYPFGKYDQLIVPDFNIGAMENIAAVTFTEGYVQRQPSDRTQRENRASVILHEMAHMWFGNLVTHDWWNGLWLNESFATQMAAMAAVETTEFDDTWHGFFTNDKREAYARDGKVTTHPIEMPIGSTAEFFKVFDAITYEKGSSVLRQLAHYTGEERYRRGVSAYLEAFSYDTTELSDFIGHIEAASGTDLSRWTDDWLHTPGFNTLRAETGCEDGELRELRIVQTAPSDYPVLRTHRADVALHYFDDDGGFENTEVLPVEIAGATTVVEDAAGLPCPSLVNPNHDDWTYAKLAVDERDVAVLERSLGTLPESLERSMFLAALYDRAMAGTMPLADYVELAMQRMDEEPNIRVQQQISRTLEETIDTMERLRPETDAALARLLPALEALALEQAGSGAPDDFKRTGLNTFLGVVGSEEGLATVRRLFDGSREIPGIAVSPDLRWQLLIVMSAAGMDGVDDRLAALRSADQSDFGAKSALTVEAAQPDAANKAAWLEELEDPQTVTGLSRQRAVMAGLFPANQTGLQLEHLDRILDALPALSRTADPYFLSSYTSVLLTPMCRPESVAKLEAALEQQAERLNSTALRFLREARQADRECLALRNKQG